MRATACRWRRVFPVRGGSPWHAGIGRMPDKCLPRTRGFTVYSAADDVIAAGVFPVRGGSPYRRSSACRHASVFPVRGGSPALTRLGPDSRLVSSPYAGVHRRWSRGHVAVAGVFPVRGGSPYRTAEASVTARVSSPYAGVHRLLRSRVDRIVDVSSPYAGVHRIVASCRYCSTCLPRTRGFTVSDRARRGVRGVFPVRGGSPDRRIRLTLFSRVSSPYAGVQMA